MGKKLSVTFRVGADGGKQVAIGRDAWALKNLVSAGERGCTPIDHPGPRWSHYIRKLRQAGVAIETVYETHGGTFAGTHGRYVLRSAITIISDTSNPGGLAA